VGAVSEQNWTSLPSPFTSVTQLVDASDVMRSKFYWLADAKGMRRHRVRRVHTNAAGQALSEGLARDAGAALVESCESAFDWWGLFEADGSIVLVRLLVHGTSEFFSASRTEEQAERMAGVIRLLAPKKPAPADDSVNVTFWSDGKDGPQSLERRIMCDRWESIADNYSALTRAALSAMMIARPPLPAGTIALLHGDPGTGKTRSVMAFALAVREWANTHYITDPERFFGKAPYMLGVLLGANDDDKDGVVPEQGQNPKGTSGNGKWNVLVVEDADEFVSVEAKREQGQAMSRLLNIADGIVGQGMRVLTVLTANERLEKLHPAVGRPGRCLANIEFGRLSEDESVGWINAHGGSSLLWPRGRRATIAELYDHVREDKQIVARVDRGTPGVRQG